MQLRESAWEGCNLLLISQNPKPRLEVHISRCQAHTPISAPTHTIQCEKYYSPLGQTPGANTLLLIPHGASRFAIVFPKCVHAALESVYDMERMRGSTLNAPEEDIESTCEE
jgi:hypothetical protein